MEEATHCFRIKDLLFYSDEELGTGSDGTTVFRGAFGEREVAVKRLRKSKWSRADKEAQNLLRSKGHQNIIQCFATRKCSQFVYLALQLCDATLQQVVEDDTSHPKIIPFDIFKQALEGLTYLHGLNSPIVHRDVKPSNVLIYYPTGNGPPRGLLSDLGLSKQLNHLHTSFTNSVRGTRGWVAPEILRYINNPNACKNQKITLKCDIFNAGLLYYYVCSGGKHPFGEGMIVNEHDIMTGKYSIGELLEKYKHFGKIIQSMIQIEPEYRPAAKDVLKLMQRTGKKQKYKTYITIKL